MSDSNFYDDDILLWSEQQAAAIRRLRETARGLPNELDIENVAEEIESVGRSELAAVESYIQLVLLHLTKRAVEPEADSAAHWRQEIGGFHSALRRRYSPSMRHRIDIDEIWSEAAEQFRLGYDPAGTRLSGAKGKCPLTLDDLLAKRIDLDDLLDRVREGLHSPGDDQ